MDIEDIINWFKNQGIEIKCKWGFEGGTDNISIFGIGRYYEGNYKGFRFICCKVTSERGLLLGILIKFYYSKAYQLGLACTSNISAFSLLPYRLYRGRDLLARKFDSGINGLNCWAMKKNIAEKLFQQEKIVKTINTLKSILNIPKDSGIVKQILDSTNGLWIDDSGIGVIISEENVLTIFPNIIDAMFEFCSAVDNFAKYYSSEVFKPGKVQRVFNAIVIGLIILVILWIIWLISAAF